MRRRTILLALSSPFLATVGKSLVSGLTPTAEASQQPSLADVISATIGRQNGTYGIAIRNLKTGETLAMNSDQFFPAASLYKLAVLYEVFRQQSIGALSFAETLMVSMQDTDEQTAGDPLVEGDRVAISKALAAMIQVSSNNAAH